ncbi:hypothetical protein [Aestuariivivens sediminicola]|uniref:hypothetical protein n=1 Tax=Aestuariivivens sediminicola TaxID=2913560 RepID=UPI001F58E444|nr:hypothetical protein [Aestuariivivens sediminicola]
MLRNHLIHVLLSGVTLMLIGCSTGGTDGTSVQAQITFIKTLGGSSNDSGRSIIKTFDGGYVIAGHTQSSDGDIANKLNSSFDYWIMKFDATDTLQWQKTYGGSDQDRANDIIQTEDGGFAVLGFSNSANGDVTENEGQTDYWLLKLDGSGNLSWQRSFGYSGVDNGISMIQTRDGGYLLAGILDVSASGGLGNSRSALSKKHAGGDYWVIKLDPMGTMQWSKYYGGNFTDTPNGLFQTADNDYIIVGFSDSNDVDISNNQGSYDFWIIKISETGDLIWEHSYGGSEIDEAWGIIDSGNGNYLIVGNTRSNDKNVTQNKGAADLWLIKINDDGNLLWEKCLGGSNFDQGQSISKSQDNTFIISGNSRSTDGNVSENKGQNDAWIMKIDGNGNLVWEKSIGGSGIDLAFDAVTLNDNSIVAVGASNSTDQDIEINKGFTDLLLIKIND